MAILKNTNIDDTGIIQIPKGTTAQRPSNPESGMVRFNTETGNYEIFLQQTGWSILFQSSIVPIQATGGEIQDWLIGNSVYRVHAFKSTGTSTFNVTNAGTSGKIDILVVAGGGSGGRRRGGGGGGGGVVFKPNHEITATSYNIVVGEGGQNTTVDSGPNGSNGDNSSAFGLTAIGGGRGAASSTGNYNGDNGGSGGGGSSTNRSPGSSTQTTFTGAFSFGNDGGDGASTGDTGGGGGGAGAPGQNARNPRFPGDGGIGVNFSHVFTANYGEEGFFSGGGGGSFNDNTDPRSQPGFGGKGGGGDGAFGSGGFTSSGGGSNPDLARKENCQPGMPNTGGGGGGRSSNPSTWNRDSNPGGSGIVLIRYKIAEV